MRGRKFTLPSMLCEWEGADASAYLSSTLKVGSGPAAYRVLGQNIKGC